MYIYIKGKKYTLSQLKLNELIRFPALFHRIMLNNSAKQELYYQPKDSHITWLVLPERESVSNIRWFTDFTWRSTGPRKTVYFKRFKFFLSL